MAVVVLVLVVAVVVLVLVVLVLVVLVVVVTSVVVTSVVVVAGGTVVVTGSMVLVGSGPASATVIDTVVVAALSSVSPAHPVNMSAVSAAAHWPAALLVSGVVATSRVCQPRYPESGHEALIPRGV